MSGTLFNFSSMVAPGTTGIRVFNASGILSATPIPGQAGAYQVTSASATINGFPVTLSTYANADNKLFNPGNQVGATELDPSGLSFSAASGKLYNIATFPPGSSTYGSQSTDTSADAVVTFSATPLVCYASGTLIRTPRGDLPVETLAIGDLVLTTSGAARPITWLGHRTIDCARHPTPAEVLPYRVAAGAFGPNRPDRDLFLSPAHAILVDDVLVQVRHLADGHAIAQVPADRITYHHVELATHDLLLANNLPAESYLDTGNRAFFANIAGSTALHATDAPRTTAGFCRPVITAGPLLSSIRARRAGQSATPAAAAESRLRLVVHGIPLAPAARGQDWAEFHLPAGTANAVLTTPTLRDTTGHGRPWGVPLRALAVADGSTWRDLPLDHPALTAGWHAPAADAAGPLRWTDGHATLPATLFADHPGPVRLRLYGALFASYATASDPFAPALAA